MPKFDLKGIKIAEYELGANNAVSYANAQTIGDAMGVNMELRFAEARLYAEGRLAEYVREVTGGTLSIAEKYIPAAAQKVLFGSREKTRSITPSGGTAKSITGLVTGSDDSPKYVGVAGYAPDMIDTEKKFYCFHFRKAKFGLPSMAFTTKGETIQFATPTATGELMADDSATHDIIEDAIVDSEAEAIAWVDTVLA